MANVATTVHGSIEEINRNQWNNVIDQSDLGSVFHRYEWLLAVERGLGYEPRHAVVQKGGNPIGVFPNFVTSIDVPSWATIHDVLPTDRIPGLSGSLRRWIPTAGGESIPLTRVVSASPGYGGPVVTADEGKIVPMLCEAIAEGSTKSDVYHRIKAKETDFTRYAKLLAKHGYEPALTDCRFEVDLEPEFGDVVGDMDKERRKALRDAQSADHQVRDLKLTGDTVPATYRRYVIDMERAGGHVLPRSFFEAVATTFTDRTKLFVAEVDGEEVGRYVMVLDDEQSCVHYFLSAIGDTENFAYNPSELLHAAAMEWAQERGYRYYDFGSTGSDFRDGTFRFKEKFGGRVIPTLQWERGCSRVLWPAYKLARKGYRGLVY